MLRKLLHKLLFFIPLIGLLLSYANGINTVAIKLENEVSKFHSNLSDTKKTSCLHETTKITSYYDYFFEESELEDDIEDDLEFNWFSFNSNSETFTSSLTENQKLYNNTSFCLLQKSTPLYDLFCNWKHHLS